MDGDLQKGRVTDGEQENADRIWISLPRGKAGLAAGRQPAEPVCAVFAEIYVGRRRCAQPAAQLRQPRAGVPERRTDRLRVLRRNDDTSWYETFDLSAAAVRGENTLEIEVWYQGVSSNCYTAGRAYVIFAVMRGEGACAVASGAQTLCRADTAYRAGKVPTNQTGMVWYYDQPAEPQRYAPAAELRRTDGAMRRARSRVRCSPGANVLRSARTAICCRATGNRLSRRFCRHGKNASRRRRRPL